MVDVQRRHVALPALDLDERGAAAGLLAGHVDAGQVVDEPSRCGSQSHNLRFRVLPNRHARLQNRVLSSHRLTPFSYCVLALVGEGGAGPHDLARMMRQGRIYWTAAESQWYAEPKRLEELGYLRSE